MTFLNNKKEETADMPSKKENLRKEILWIVLMIIIVIIVVLAHRSYIKYKNRPFYSINDVNYYNSMYLKYEGFSDSTMIRFLLSRARENANTFRDTPDIAPTIILYTKSDGSDKEINKVPYKTLQGRHYDISESSHDFEYEQYVEDIDAFKRKIKEKHNYRVVFRYSEDDIILGIAIADVTNMNEEEIQKAVEKMNKSLNEIDDVY